MSVISSLRLENDSCLGSLVGLLWGANRNTLWISSLKTSIDNLFSRHQNGRGRIVNCSWLLGISHNYSTWKGRNVPTGKQGASGVSAAVGTSVMERKDPSKESWDGYPCPQIKASSSILPMTAHMAWSQNRNARLEGGGMEDSLEILQGVFTNSQGRAPILGGQVASGGFESTRGNYSPSVCPG